LEVRFPPFLPKNYYISTQHAKNLSPTRSNIDLEQLGLYRSVFPKATIAECRAYLFNLDPTKEPYSDSQVHRAECFLGLRRKAASTTADLAFLPVNLQKREFYWTLPPPLGMIGVPIADIIDIDEAVFFLEHLDRRHGKTPSCLRCSQNGVYGRGAVVIYNDS
jgi:hypothetical protein